MTRANSEGLDAILGREYPVLDKGFIRVVDYMGNDTSVVQAARVSYGDGTKELSKDRGLIRYLMSHQHTTPFEMCEIKFHIKMPIFVARQLMRHRTASINELSGRYSVMPDERYLPDTFDMRKQSSDNKQGRGDPIDRAFATQYRVRIDENGKHDKNLYQEMISDRVDLTRELARTVLPLSTYTEFYWKLNLHNLLRFLSLRTDTHSQKEMRDYADAMCRMVKLWTPITYEAWNDYVKEGVRFSKAELDIMVALLPEDDGLIPYNYFGLSAREYKDFRAKMLANIHSRK